MTDSRTVELMSRMPRWFVEQARAAEAQARQRREAEAKRFELEFLFAIEIKESGWDEWQNTVAQFSPADQS